MGSEKQHIPVLLFCGVLASDRAKMDSVLAVLEQELGSVLSSSGIIPFDYTDYYVKEIGSNILRCYLGFDRLIDPFDLYDIKRETNKIEQDYVVDGNRMVNLDPGYISKAKLVLATTKDATHRIYGGNGIYAEATLYFEDKTYHPWKWTYPDYKDKKNIDFFNRLRQEYKNKLNKTKK